MTFGERVKSLRNSKKMTQDDLAKRSKLGLGQISKIERGDNREPQLTTIKKLMIGLDVTADKLIPGEKDEGLKGILKGYLEAVDTLPVKDISAIIRIIENLLFEQRMRQTMIVEKPDEIEIFESELLNREIREREEEEHLVMEHEIMIEAEKYNKSR
jgi:transcriptional regulator with XRE-family HTH domain